MDERSAASRLYHASALFYDTVPLFGQSNLLDFLWVSMSCSRLIIVLPEALLAIEGQCTALLSALQADGATSSISRLLDELLVSHAECESERTMSRAHITIMTAPTASCIARRKDNGRGNL